MNESIDVPTMRREIEDLATPSCLFDMGATPLYLVAALLATIEFHPTYTAEKNLHAVCPPDHRNVLTPHQRIGKWCKDSHPPHRDRPAAHRLLPAEQLVRPRLAFGTVEQDEMALLRAAMVHVRRGMREAVANRLPQTLVQHLVLHHESARRLALRPGDEQVGAPPSQAVLPLDASASVHHPLQERLQQQLRAGLKVVEALHPVLGMLPEELLDGGEQLDDVQTAIRIDVPRGVLRKSDLGGPGQLPRDGLGVDGIGDAQRAFVRDQPEVPDVLDIAGGELPPVAAGLFLVTGADAKGLSYYADASVCARLGVSGEQLVAARQALIGADLIAFETPLYQVLSLDRPTTVQRPSGRRDEAPIRLADLLRDPRART